MQESGSYAQRTVLLIQTFEQSNFKITQTKAELNPGQALVTEGQTVKAAIIHVQFKL